MEKVSKLSAADTIYPEVLAVESFLVMKVSREQIENKTKSRTNREQNPPNTP